MRENMFERAHECVRMSGECVWVWSSGQNGTADECVCVSVSASDAFAVCRLL